jgi:spermidine synthase
MLARDHGDARLLYRAGHGSSAIAVYENDCYRWLQNENGTLHSLLDLHSPQRLILPYTQAMMAALLFIDAIDSVLMLGLGGASQARFLRHHFAHARITVLESNADVIDVARRYFDLSDDNEKLRVSNKSARTDIATDGPPADLILMDLFCADGLPSWVRDKALHQRCRHRLGIQGVLAANLWVDTDDEHLRVMDGVQEAFENRTLVLGVPGYRNLVVLAFNNTPPLDFATLGRRAAMLGDQTGLDFTAQLVTMRESNFSDETGFVF